MMQVKAALKDNQKDTKRVLLTIFVLFTDRYHAALTEIQSVLIEVLAKQQSEKENLARKYRSVQELLSSLA